MTIKNYVAGNERINTVYTAFKRAMELKLASIGRLFQTLTTLSQKKVQRIPVLCGLKTLYL